MLKSNVTSKGQITIPAEIRRAFGIHSGDAVEFVVHEDNRIELMRAQPKASAAGFLKSKVSRAVGDADINRAITDGWRNSGRD